MTTAKTSFTLAQSPSREAGEPSAPGDGPGEPSLFKVPRVAWGTVALFSGLFTGWSVALAGGVLGWLPTPAAMALSGASVFAAFTVMHDASHNAVSRVRWLNSLLGHASASLLFLTFVHFKNVHLRHHRFTGDPARDPDRFTGEGPSWMLPLRWATADVHYALAYEAPEGGMSKRDARETWLSLAVVAAIALGLCLSGHAVDFVLFWLLPARVMLFWLAYSFDYVPHQRPHCRSRDESPYRASFVVGGRAMTVLMLCQNYHLVHHLYPSVPFYRYPQIWRDRRAVLLAKGARLVRLLARPRPVP
ncbi:fatty acid desaturase [Sorangium sp. So ce136]|uniref:fatty acid desaturase n=1 Tax=Sorangium sp. So ce136 TaxID=3133284 RepID=UPI003F07EE2B